MDDMPDGLVGFIIGFFLSCVLWFVFTTPDRMWHAEAVKRGAAEYDTKTGDWKWVEKKEPQTEKESK